MFTIYTSGDLIGVVESLENKPLTFIRDRYFPFEQISDAELIMFDVVDKKRRLAPFVSPLVRGKLVESRGYSTRSFRPAYVKPKSEINPNGQFRRLAGEPITAPLSPAQRRDVHIRESLMEHEEMCDMREEVMCVEALRLGQVTVSGDGFPTTVVSFGRHVDLTVTLAGALTWDNSGVTPLVDIRTWAKLVRQHSNAIVTDVILEDDGYEALLARLTDAEKTVLFDSLRGSESKVELGPRSVEKVRFEGRIGQFNFWTYNDTYVDVDGVEQQVMPSGQVILAGREIEGTRCYGAIRDARAGLVPMRRFPKMWMEEDPSTEWAMTQSAPLMVPLRPNASLGARVL